MCEREREREREGRMEGGITGRGGGERGEREVCEGESE